MGKSRSDVWMRHETRTKVYLAVRAAGREGITRKGLREALPELSAKTVDNHMQALLREGYLRRPMLGIGWYELGRYLAGPRVPPVDGLALAQAMALLRDCPAGVSAQLICDEVGCSMADLLEQMQPLEADGMVRRIVMSARHGGGFGWALPDADAAAEETGYLTVAEMACEHEHVRLPVVEVDIDRIHRADHPGPFRCEMVGNRLTISSGSLAMTLPATHTEQLLQYLVPHVQRSAQEALQ